MRLPAALAPLRIRAYRLLWLGQTTSAAGNALVQVAFVFAILRTGGSAASVGYILALESGVGLAFILVGGVWADRLRRQAVMLAADLVRALAEVVLAVLLTTGRARLWELAAGAAVAGLAAAFFGPASTGLLPEAVPQAQLQRANALLGSAGNLVGTGGPALAGVLVAAFGPALVLAADAATFAVSAACLARLRLGPRALPGPCSFGRDLAVGWHEVVIRPWYWGCLIAHALWNAAFAAYLVLGPVIAARWLGGAPAWGLISAAWAAGAVAGGLAALWLRPRRPLAAGQAVMVLGALPLLALAPPLATWVIALGAAAAGAGAIFLDCVWNSALQTLIPDEVRARVDSYDWLVSLTVLPAALAAVGPLAQALGIRTVLAAAAVLCLPCAAMIALPAVRQVRADGP